MSFNYNILIFLSTLVWLFPPIRQYKQNYFWFFLVLALADPFVFIVGRSFGLATPQVYVMFNVLFFLSVVDYSKLNFYKVIFYITIVLLGVISFLNYWEYSYEFIVIGFILILFAITKNSFGYVVKTGSINIFHVVLVFYILSNVLKFWNLISRFDTGLPFFIITTSFQIVVGIFFTMFAENNLKLLIRIGNHKKS